jgi:hypothetical protein
VETLEELLIFKNLFYLRFLISYLPGGQSALKLFSKLFYAFASKTVQTALPV